MCRRLATSRKPLYKVTTVPGVVGREPFLVERIKFWRTSCLFAGTLWGILNFFSACFKISVAIADVDGDLKSFPDAVKSYFRQFVYAQAAIEALCEVCTAFSIYYLIQAKRTEEKFKISRHFVIRAWMAKTIGPYLVCMIPAGFFFRSDYFQRDVCALTVGVVSGDPLANIVFSMAATNAGEPALASAVGIVPSISSPNYASNPIVSWCWKHLNTWPERMFSKLWLTEDTTGGVHINFAAVPLSGGYRGVVPELLKLLGTLIGLSFVDNSLNCDVNNEEPVTATSLMQLMPYLQDSRFAEVSNGTRLDEWYALKQQEIHKLTQVAEKFGDHGYGRHLSLGAVDSLGQVEIVHNATATASLHKLPRKRFSSPASLAADASGSAISITQIGDSVLCMVKKACVQGYRYVSTATILASNAAGLYSFSSIGLGRILGLLSVLQGLFKGTINVKLTLVKASAPGSTLFIALIAICIPIFFLYVIVAQVFSSLFIAGACLLISFTLLLDMQAALQSTKAKSQKSLEKCFNDCNSKAKKLKLLALLLVVCYVLNLLQSTRNAVPIPNVVSIDFAGIIRGLLKASKLATMVTNFLYVSTMTNLFTTMTVLDATLRAAGDDYGCAGQSSKEVVASYGLYRGTKTKKKKKKKKKYTLAEEEAYWGEYAAEEGKEGESEYSEEEWKQWEETEASEEASGAESAAPGDESKEEAQKATKKAES